MRHKLSLLQISLIGSVLMLTGLPSAQAGCVESMLSLANQHRQTHRQTALVLSKQLTQVAQRQAEKMAWSDDLSGDLPSDEIEATGYGKSRLGLIAAAGHRSPAQVIRYWMSSQSRDDILDENYTDVGIGCAFDPSSSYQYYWVMIFGGGQSQAGHTETRREITTQGRQTAQSLLSLTNQNRRTALVFSEQLNQAAQRQAEKMAKNLHSQVSWDEIKATYSKPHLALIVAAGYQSPADVIRFWMSSQSRVHLLDERFSDVGIGYVFDSSTPYRHYWVMIFGGGQPQAGYTGSLLTHQGRQTAQSLLTLTNQKRRAALVHSQLVFSDKLTRVAQKMAQNPHSRLEGDLPSDEIRAAGYDKPHLGLLLAAGYSSPAEVINYWMSSQNRTYLLGEDFTDIGIGYVFDSSSPYRHHWVVIFGGGQPQAGYTGSLLTQTTQERQTAQSLLTQTNKNRRTALIFSEPLNQAAQRQAEKMAKNLHSQVSWDEIKATYSKPHLALIVAAGYQSPADVIRFWMSSQSRVHLLDERFNDVGIGYVYKPSSPYRYYWVMIFGGGQPQAPRTERKQDIPQTTPKFGASDESKKPTALAVSGDGQPQAPRTERKPDIPQTTQKFGASDESKKPTALAVSGDGQPQAPRTERKPDIPQTTQKFGASDESKKPVAQTKKSLLEKTNQNRRTALVFSEPLNQAAQRQAEKMAKNLHSQVSWDEIKTTYSKPHLALIVAAGYQSPADVIRFWMSSQSRVHLLDERFSDVGIGYVFDSSTPYRHYWVMIFGGGQPQAGYTGMRQEITTPERQTAPLMPAAQAKKSLLKKTNQKRRTALIFSEPLNQVAQRHADKIARSGRLDGSLPQAQIKAAGYSKPRLGLILAAGYSSPAEVIRYWMSSQSRTYLLDERFSDVGIGYVYKPSSPYRHYWVIIFGGGQPQAGYTEMRREVTTQEWQTAQSLLEKTNQNRRTALIFSEPLNQVAQRQAEKMAQSGRLDGSLPQAQIKAAGYSKPRLGLILAAGYSSPAEVIRYWMSSQSRTYLLDERFSDVGIGYVYKPSSPYRHYWVIIFGGNY